MNRPRYETPETLANERRIIAEYCKYKTRNFGFHKLEDKYIVDFALTEGNRKKVRGFAEVIDDPDVRGFAEVKKRELEKDEIPKIVLSLDKYMALRRYAELGFVAILVFEFDDGIYHMNHNVLDPKDVTINGRKDRGDKADIEPCIWIPRELWRPIHEQQA